MPESSHTVRIFISSPGDVAEEREGARRVVDGLRRLYPGADLQTVLWEELALPATASFQETIDFLLEREPIDIAVFILWSRLGSPLGASITRPDGSTYRSGTEREFDLMLAAFEQSGRKRPVILAYVRDDDVAFREMLTACPADQLEKMIQQRKLAESFVREQFHDAEGRNLRAYQSYREPIGFKEQLKGHLRRALDDLLEVEKTATWTEDPYRGLETFDVQHAPIFYGRDEETCDLLQRLRDQRRRGCAFVVIVAASGSGKSSLARAGVAANLIQGGEDDEGVTWHVASLIPALAERSLCHTLAGVLAETLPDLVDSDEAAERIGKGLGENAPLMVEQMITPAFDRADKPVRLLLILDQMEELWTDKNTSEDDRERFLAAVAALAESGHLAVLATLRSDFYHHAQRSPTFLKLKGERGQYDLLPPDAASIHRLITEPARLAGLGFSRNEKTGKSLDEVIWEDASHDADALPLLEYTLSELYRQRDESRQVMTFAAYVELGGVEGAIGKRADETFADLPADAQAALNEILPLLVSVDVAGEQSAVRRRASVADLTAKPARKTLTDELIAQRFLTTDREGDTPVASLAHEALLRSWDRVVGWINANREQLRLRARVEQQQQRWQQQDQDESLLLPAGLPLDEGKQLLSDAPYLLAVATKDYIETSIAHHDQKSKRSRRVRTAVFLTIAALMVALTGGGIAAWRINDETKRKAALEQRASEASGLVQRLLDVDPMGLKDAIDDLVPYQDLVRESLTSAYEDSKKSSKAKLHAGLALASHDDSVLPFLRERLLEVTPAQFGPVRDLLDDQKGDLTEYYWGIVEDLQEEDDRRFQAACALAAYDPKNEAWEDSEFTPFVADHLVGVLPSELVPWRNALEPVREQLVPALGAIFRDSDRGEQVRSFATDTLADYTSDDFEALFELLMDAEPKQFAALFDGFAKYGDQAIAKLDDEINRVLEPSWNDPPLDPAWAEPEEEQLVEKIAQADGMIAERFAFCQTLPLDEFQAVADQLSRSGYRPIRLRPYSHEGTVRAAAAWTRDGRDWRFATSESAESMLGQDEAMRTDGFVAVDVAGFLAGGDDQAKEQYAGVWVKQQSDDEDARVYVGVPYARHKEAYGELEEAGYKFQHSLQGFRSLDGQQKYCGVKTKASGSGSWSWNLSLVAFDQKLYLDKIHWDIDPSRAADPETTRQRNEDLLADAEARLQEKPDDLQARFDRAKARFYLGQNAEALADMGYLVQYAPNFATTYQYRSILYARLGDADAARMDLQHFDSRSTSEAIKAYLDLVVSAHLGDEPEAIKRLEERVDQNRGDDGVLYDAACAYSVAAGVYQGQDDDKAGRYADRSVALLGEAIAAGYSNYSHIQEDADLDSIRQHGRFAELMKPANLGLRFAAVWNTSTRFESQASYGLSPSDHLEQCRNWQDQAYRLVSISTASVDGELVTASVWHRPLIAREARESLAKRQANAASAMARLAQTDKLFPVLRVHDDPESLTQFVHRCREEGVTPRQLLACLELADRGRQALRGDARQIEDRILFGLLLALGEFNLDELPADKQQITVEQVGRWYDQDASSAIHGAAGWLLRRWGQTDLVRQVDETAREYDPEREWFTLAIKADDQTFYQTYVVVPPGEYSIGSPADEPGRDSDERLHLVRLTRPVAILDREITRKEYEASGHQLNIDQYSPTSEHPMVAPSWYDSVKFCRWLTEQAGFSDAEQAYPDPSVLDAAEYARDGETDLPKNWPVNLEARGFRLPTEAEWEVAARAGMPTRYSFGGDETLLDRYAWYQGNSGRRTHVAKELRPNLRGLFDMHGNVYEWCHDWYDSYPLGSVRTDPVGSSTGSFRVDRGGGWRNDAANCRTAYRFSNQPTDRSSGIGLRLALVPFEPSGLVAEPDSEGPEGASGAATGEAERSAEPGGDQATEQQ